MKQVGRAVSPVVLERPETSESREYPETLATSVRQLPDSATRVAEAAFGNEVEWMFALQRALGTSSSHFVRACLQRLINVCTLPGEGVARTTSINAALALIQSLDPQNEAQAALAVNVACLHAALTSVLSRISHGGGDRRLVMLATAASRLERSYNSAMITYHRIRHGSQQIIRVEKVEVHPGGQAMVGIMQTK